jgi:hypothetical protein
VLAHLPQYYFDIETVPLEQYRSDVGASFDPSNPKIITIQHQRLDSSAGGPLMILKEMGVRVFRKSDN